MVTLETHVAQSYARRSLPLLHISPSPSWENKGKDELSGISAQFFCKDHCKKIFQCYIFFMNYPTTQSSLLERVQQGDEILWNEFYCRYAPVIRAAGMGFKFNETECDDLVQQVMLKFFNHAQTFVYRKGEVKFRTYFAQIVRSQAVDMIRRNAAQKNLHCEFPENHDPFDELFMEEWRKAVFEEAKTELRLRVDDKTFMAFELYGLQNRKIDAVADILEMTPNQIYVAKNRCTNILQKIIQRHNENDGELNLEI